MEIRISVRGLVEFILRSGDIDNRRMGAMENAMQEGSRIHRMIQKRMGDEYQAEYFLRYKHETKNYTLIVEGRADGIMRDATGAVMVDEIKSTYKEVERMKQAVPVHLAQAKVYAAIYGMQNAYRYPGMNKVLQAAGRVIRTADDVGIIVLLDERFLQPAYQKLFPREWEGYESVTKEGIAKRITRFWDSWL